MARPLAWADTSVAFEATAGLALVDLLAAAAPIPSDTITVARLIIDLSVYPVDLDQNVVYVQRVVAGVGVASDRAFAVAGGLGLPDPRVSNNAPPRGWLWKGSWVIAFSNSATFGVEVSRFPEVSLDLRANRKLDKGTLFMVTGKTAISGAETDVDVIGNIRVLCMT